MDVKLSFLNGILEEEVCVDQPPSYTVKGHEDKVFKLKKALYGLNKLHELGIVGLIPTSSTMVSIEASMSPLCMSKQRKVKC